MASHSVRQLVEHKMGTFGQFVIYVLLEWILILLLFIDGILAFLSNQFAKYFDLRMPCLLCTRIDHVFVHRNPDFYCNESVCDSHKKNISRMAYCHVHKKLSDIRNMCEGCLLSFATEKDADCDTYKSLVGILNKNLECFVEDDSKIHLKFPGVVRREEDVNEVEKMISPELFCSCCGDPLKVRLQIPKGSTGGVVSNKVKQVCTAPTPTPRSPYLSAKNEESRSLDSRQVPYAEMKSLKGSQGPCEESSNTTISDAKLTDSERHNEDPRTPIFAKGNKFFGIALSDSPTSSPKWTSKLYKKSPLEKTEHAATADSNDGNVANYEIDGESILHRLKRQVRLDRKSLIELYMELDEERSASTEAANNAMAMITRLQAEKAAVQMEALQYQRMMEEQAEYDQEAIQVMKELLDKREEDVKGLETELEVYRDRYGVIDLPLQGIDEYEEEADLRNSDEFDLESRLRTGLEDADTSVESTYDNVVKNEHVGGGSESTAALKGEMSDITQRLQGLEEDGARD